MITTIEDLEKVLKVLRSQGVLSFKMSGTEIILGEMPVSDSVIRTEGARSRANTHHRPNSIVPAEPAGR